jgi:hypothetical protein
MFPRLNRPLIGSRSFLLYRQIAGLGLLGLLGCGSELPGEPPDLPDQPGAPVSMVAVSSPMQIGLAGDELSEPLVVRVSDAAGQGLPGVAVYWIAVGGPDVICTIDRKRCGTQRLTVTTNTDGVAQVWYRPRLLGAGAVTALAPAVPQGQVSFDFETNGVLIRLAPRYGECGTVQSPLIVLGPDGSHEVTIPAGTRIEWEHVEVEFWYPESSETCLARITSHIVPEGGLPFESEDFTVGDRFRFTPNVAGTWMFREVYTGSFGTITVVAH